MPPLDLAASSADGPTVRTIQRVAPAPFALALGATSTVVLIVLAAMDPGATGRLWELGHWNVAALTAVVASALSARDADGLTRRVRIGAAVAFLSWWLGMATWTVMVIAGMETIPSLADAFSAAFVIPGAWMLWISVRERLHGADELAVYLDVALVALATVAVIVAVRGAAAYDVGGIPGLLVVAYPALYIAAGLAAFVVVLAARQPLVSGGGVAFGVGATITGMAWVGWVLPVATGGQPDPTLNALFSLGPLVSGYGAITWSEAVESRPAIDRLARLGGWAVGPAALGTIALAASVAHDGPPAVEELLHGILVGSAALLIVRTAFHLRERGEMVRELEAARVENERLIGRLRAELVEREQTQQRLVDASRMSAVGELAAAVAHEVNNPLTSVLGYADLLLATSPPAAPQRGDIEVIRSEAIRVRDRVRSLLDFATPRRPEAVPSELAAVVAAPLDLLRYHLDRGGVSVDLRAEPMEPVELDPPAIQQVLVNLISVMAAAMPQGGRIGIVTRPAGDRASIVLEVDRTDLDPGLVARWILPFEVRSDTPAADAGGHGIAATVGVLRGHGGTIALRRSPSGRPRIEITLPYRQPDPAAG